jgi:DNA-binding IclR family transcriptional regulator
MSVVPVSGSSIRAVPGSAGEAVLTVQRGMQVLRAFRSEGKALSNAELVRRTGLSKATISRLTSTLIELGFLRRTAGGRQFELSAGPLSIGHAYIGANPVIRHAHPFMQELADRLNVSVALATANELDMLYVAHRSSRKIATLTLGIGSLLPMGHTAIGRAYLWALAPADRKEKISALKQAAGPDAASLERGIRTSFQELEQTGTCFALGVSGYQRDAYGIALPVRVGIQKIVMALSCGSIAPGPKIDATRSRVSDALQEAAPEFEKLMAGVDCDD